jgi:hypothetical protein
MRTNAFLRLKKRILIYGLNVHKKAGDKNENPKDKMGFIEDWLR